jgi:hypothetical protein
MFWYINYDNIGIPVATSIICNNNLLTYRRNLSAKFNPSCLWLHSLKKILSKLVTFYQDDRPNIKTIHFTNQPIKIAYVEIYTWLSPI